MGHEMLDGMLYLSLPPLPIPLLFAYSSFCLSSFFLSSVFSILFLYLLPLLLSSTLHYTKPNTLDAVLHYKSNVHNSLDCYPATLQPSFLVYILLHHSHSLQLHWSCPHPSGAVLLAAGNSNCRGEQHTKVCLDCDWASVTLKRSVTGFQIHTVVLIYHLLKWQWMKFLFGRYGSCFPGWSTVACFSCNNSWKNT